MGCGSSSTNKLLATPRGRNNPPIVKVIHVSKSAERLESFSGSAEEETKPPKSPAKENNSKSEPEHPDDRNYSTI